MSKRLKLLFVDDEPINLMLFQTCFGESYHVITAESGAEALKILAENSDISVVFTDMKMPWMSGVEFARKAKPLYPRISFYILTGYGLSELIQQAIDDGVLNGCLFKPFDIDEVEQAIVDVVNANIRS